MFYHIRPNGFPVPFESFEAYLESLTKHAVDVNTTTNYTVRLPERSDYGFNEYPIGLGFEGKALRIWHKDGAFVGYEF